MIRANPYLLSIVVYRAPPYLLVLEAEGRKPKRLIEKVTLKQYNEVFFRILIFKPYFGTERVNFTNQESKTTCRSLLWDFFQKFQFKSPKLLGFSFKVGYCM